MVPWSLLGREYYLFSAPLDKPDGDATDEK